MLLEIDCLNLWFKGFDDDGTATETQVLHDVSLSLKKGETLALVGESGSGKSITALSILRLLETISDVRSTGSIFLDDVDVFNLDQDQLRAIRGRKAAMIFQEPMNSLNPVFTIGNQLMEPLLLHGKRSKKEAEKKAVNLLKKTGLKDAKRRFNAYPFELSGGQRQRAMIAMALAGTPQLLIADEPTTALDVAIQTQILSLIKELQQEYAMGLLLITHDLTIVGDQAENICIMKDGCIVESGKTRNIFDNPGHPYTKKLLAAIPKATKRKTAESPILVETRNLNCSFQKDKGLQNIFKKKEFIQVVKNVSLQFKEGTTFGIVGESGSGKTSLAMAILRLHSSDGKILFNKTNLQELTQKQLKPFRSDFQVVFQDPFASLSPRLTVLEIVEEGLLVHRRSLARKERHGLVMEALKEVGLEEEMAYRYPHEFSGGQRQRIAIARVIILKPKFIIFDEPTSALDVTIQGQIIDLLQDLQQKYNMTYMFISHDLRVIRAMSDFVAVMQDGEVIESGPAKEVFLAPQHDYTRTLVAAYSDVL